MLDVSEQEPFADITCPSCGERMRVRTRFDHFELVEAIASGGMGTVYRAKDLTLDRVVALKLLRKEFSVDQDYIEKLETEAKITASVNHPHVVKVFSFGCDQGLYYIAMELVDKGSLDDLMNLQQRIAEVQVLEVGIQVAQGLRAAYQAGLIHRDVKPGNILFSDARTAKIVDFGLAMPLEQAQEAEEEIWGTPYYVAPEKLNHEPEDFRSDIYSLGGTLFHALAGRPPFEAENASLVALKHLKSQIVSLQAFAPDISSPTSYVINRTLAKNPDDRYQSYDELIEHFEYARTKLLENSGKPRQAKTRVVMEGEEQQKAFGIIIMAVLAFIVVLGGVLFLFKDKIVNRNRSLAEIQRERLLQASGSAEEAYNHTRKLISEGDAVEAFPLLWQLEHRPNLSQPLKSWIILHAGMAAYQGNLPNEGRRIFQKLGAAPAFSSKPEDAELAAFFSMMGREMGRDGALPLATIRDYEGSEYQPLALYLFGLKEWSGSRFENAVRFFEAYQKANPTGAWEWVSQYKPIAQRYLDDAAGLPELLKEIRAARTPEARLALLPKLEAMRANLQMGGRLPEFLALQERQLQGAAPRRPGAGSVASLVALREQALRLVRDFQPDQARKMVEDATVLPSDEEARAALLKRIAYVSEFKKRLISDLETIGYNGFISRKRGGTVSGKVIKAGDFRLDVQLDGKPTSLLWTDLTPEGISTIAVGMVRTRPGETPDAGDIDRLWFCGVYDAMSGRREDAFPRLMRAATYKREYAYDLPLFD